MLYIDSAGCLLILNSLMSCWRWLPLLVSGFLPPRIRSHEGYEVNNPVVDCLIQTSHTEVPLSLTLFIFPI